MLKLVEKGWSREQAYDTVQPNAIKSWENKIEFKQLMKADANVVATLSDEEIEACFDPTYQIRNVDVIYKRVGLL